MKLKNDNGMWIDEENNCCLGYLMDFSNSGHGVHSPNGQVPITPEQAKIHNDLLSQAEILGLDKCEIGQYGTFYYINGKVSTFMGTVVSENIHLSPSKKTITFVYNGKQFRGTLQRDADCFNFKRIS